jgi:glutathione synthase/RimK-type ligase-like ATP-grasp enzyme
LRFSLFGPTSKFFTGDEITTRDYQTAMVKNSFGQTELRYKVRLPASIHGRTINIRFTLANRSRNDFPVLIGRRTLHGRFVVDVSRAEKKKFSILVLKTKPLKRAGSFERFFKELEGQRLSSRFTHATYKDLRFIFSGKKLNVKIDGLNKDIANFDLVHFLVVGDHKDVASAAARYLNTRDTPFIDRAAAEYYQSLNKLHQYIILQSVGVRIPRTIYMDKSHLSGSYKYLSDFLGRPFILKDIHGRKGRSNYLIRSKKQFDEVISHEDAQMIAQKYIHNDGDYRILVFGRQAKMIIKRKAVKGSHLNNISSLGKAELVKDTKIPASVKSRAIKAAEALKIDVAGVDMVHDKDSGLWYCLEVNESPQLVSSAFVDEKQQAFVDYLNRKLHKL